MMMFTNAIFPTSKIRDCPTTPNNINIFVHNLFKTEKNYSIEVFPYE